MKKRKRKKDKKKKEEDEEERIICFCKTGFSKMSPPDVGPPLVMVSVAESARAAGGEITLCE